MKKFRFYFFPPSVEITINRDNSGFEVSSCSNVTSKIQNKKLFSIKINYIRFDPAILFVYGLRKELKT